MHDIQQNNNIVFKTLGDIFYIKKGTVKNSKNIDGRYTFISSSERHKTHNNYTHDCECIIFVGSGSNKMLAKAHYFNGKFVTSERTYVLTIKNKNKNKINYKYIWYYLNLNQEKHLSDNTIYCGRLIKIINRSRCSNIKIPIPPIEYQNRVVENLDITYINFNKIHSDTMNAIHKHEEYIDRKMSFENKKVKILKNICDINFGTLVSKNKNTIDRYPVVRGNGSIRFYTDSFNRQGFNILIQRFPLLVNCVRFTNDNIFLDNSGLTIKPKINNVLHKFIGYYLYYNQDIIYNSTKGIIYKSLDMNAFKNIKIPIPSIERQREIIEYCENKDKIIKIFEKNIEENKKHAESYMCY